MIKNIIASVFIMSASASAFAGCCCPVNGSSNRNSASEPISEPSSEPISEPTQEVSPYRPLMGQFPKEETTIFYENGSVDVQNTLLYKRIKEINSGKRIGNQ